MQIGFSLMVIQNLLLGPSKLIGLGDHVIYLFIGMFMMGGNMALGLVPTLAETIEIL